MIESQRLDVSITDAKLRCMTNHGVHQYYVGKEYQKKENMLYVTKLANKEYRDSLLPLLKKTIKHLENLQNIYEKRKLEQTYAKLCPARKHLVEPLIIPIEERVKEFEQQAYEGKPFEEDNTTSYYTFKGERVRSKSEKIIADELARYHIPYRYEYPLTLKINNRTVTFYPDFTALNVRTGEKKIIEHFGMMDKEEYIQSAMRKLDCYENNNILLGRDLILFHETSIQPLNTKIVQKYIEENFI